MEKRIQFGSALKFQNGQRQLNGLITGRASASFHILCWTNGNRFGEGNGVMNDDRLERLRNLVSGYHRALVEHDFSNIRWVNLRNYPVECCHHACKLLTVFLFEQGFNDIERRIGSLPNDPTGRHLWLVVEGVLVDITACQFKDGPDETIVAKDSEWHLHLNGTPSQFGRDGESLGEYVKRARSEFDGLCEELELATLRIMSE